MTTSTPNNTSLNVKASESTASLIEEERIIAKLTIKTLSDKTIKLDFIDPKLSLAQLKEQLQVHVELAPEQQFFLIGGQVYGKENKGTTTKVSDDNSVLIVNLPGFKSPETVVQEFKNYEESRKRESEEAKDSSSSATPISIVKGVEELLPTIYIFHFEPAAKALDPLESASDWDQKNRLKFFKGIWSLSQRNLTEAANFLVEALPTFEENGCIPYKDLVKYAVISASVTFDRPSLKAKVSNFIIIYHFTLFLLL